MPLIPVGALYALKGVIMGVRGLPLVELVAAAENLAVIAVIT